jgi:MscS family membrane protein
LGKWYDLRRMIGKLSFDQPVGSLHLQQWLAIPVAAAAAWALGALLGWVTRRVLGRLAARTETKWDDELLVEVARPLTALWAVGVALALLPWLALGAAIDAKAEHGLRAAAWFVLFWGLARAAGVGFRAAGSAPWARQNAGLAGLLPMGRRLARLALLALGLVAVLNELGFQVASLLAGLGIGGLALALAAQKTVEHLFGSLAIGVDQPFRVGDLVTVDGVTGTVEAIGMRSTRLRTLDRTIVSFPNGKLAESRTECLTARDRIRLVADLGLTYGSTAAQVRRVLADVEGALRAHPKTWPDALSVRLTELRDSSLHVEVMAWIRTTDWDEFTAVRQELLLRFLEIVEQAGTSLAFPTRTVRLERR